MRFIFFISIICILTGCINNKDTTDSIQINKWHFIDQNKNVDNIVFDTIVDLTELKFTKTSLFSKHIFDSIIINSSWNEEIWIEDKVIQIDTTFERKYDDELLLLTQLVIASPEIGYGFVAIYSTEYGLLIKNTNGHGIAWLEEIRIINKKKDRLIDLKKLTKELLEMNELFPDKELPPPLPIH